MVPGVDLKPPTDAQLDAFWAAGYRVIGLYHGTVGNGIDPAHLASDDDFRRVKAKGFGVLAYVSGNDDPRQIAAWSRAIHVPAAVDVERFIREDGPWLDPWLADSDWWIGLYGNGSVHYNTQGFRKARFHVFSGYYGYDPRVPWPGWLPHDASPTAWQFQGTTPMAGTLVDLSWFDDAFAYSLEDEMDPFAQAHVYFEMACGRPYRVAAPGVVTKTGYEPDADTVIERLRANPSDVGGTFGYLLNTQDGKDWTARKVWLRSMSMEQLTALMKSVPAGGFATEAELQAAIAAAHADHEALAKIEKAAKAAGAQLDQA